MPNTFRSIARGQVTGRRSTRYRLPSGSTASGDSAGGAPAGSGAAGGELLGGSRSLDRAAAARKPRPSASAMDRWSAPLLSKHVNLGGAYESK